MVRRMRRLLVLLLAVLLSFSASRSAVAVELPCTGVLTLHVFASEVLPPFGLEGAGVADAILDANQSLAGLYVPSVFSTVGLLLPVTDTQAFPIASMIGTLANDAGAFASGPAGFGGTMPLRGTVKICLFGTCSTAVANVEVPLSVVGHGATVDVSGAPINLTVYGTR
jgi:hypothetical protein